MAGLHEILQQSAANGYKPLILFDASALVDLQASLCELEVTLPLLNGDSIITPCVLKELKEHSLKRVNGYRMKITPKTYAECERIAAHSLPIINMVRTHPNFDDYRYMALGVAYDLCSEKKMGEGMSLTDRCMVAAAMTIAAHPEEMGVQGYSPVVLSCDEHINKPLWALADPLSPYYRDTNGSFANIRVYDTRLFSRKRK